MESSSEEAAEQWWLLEKPGVGVFGGVMGKDTITCRHVRGVKKREPLLKPIFLLSEENALQ